MGKTTIINASNGELLAAEGSLANTFFTRLKGWLGKKTMPEDEGLIISPCNQVHSMGMKIVIDVLFVSSSNEIVYLIEKMTPHRISPHIRAAHYVIELPAGQISRTGTELGHRVAIQSIPGPQSR